MGNTEDALIKFAVRNLRWQELVSILKAAKDKEDLYNRMRLADKMKRDLFQNDKLWPLDERDELWKFVTSAAEELYGILPGTHKKYERPGRDVLRETIETLSAQGNVAQAKQSLDAYDRKYSGDPWSIELRKRLR